MSTTITYRGAASLLPGAEDYSAGRMSGGVYDSDGKLIEEALRDDDTFVHESPRALPSDFAPAEVIARAAFLGHWFFHFGHFMLETVPMLSMAKDLVCDKTPLLFFPVGFHLLNRQNIRSVHGDLAQRLDVALERIQFVCRPTNVLDLTVAQKPYVLNRTFSPIALRSLRRAVTPERKTRDRTRPGVYLTRRRLLPDIHRFCVNEYQLERLYTALGFTVFAPEQHTLSKQIEMVVSADTVVALDGSAIYLAGFAERKRVVCYALRDIPSIKFFVEAGGHEYKQITVLADQSAPGSYAVSLSEIVKTHPESRTAKLWHDSYDKAESDRELRIWKAGKALADKRYAEILGFCRDDIANLNHREAVLVSIAQANLTTLNVAEAFLRNASMAFPDSWQIAKLYIDNLISQGNLAEAAQVLRRPEFSVDSEWLARATDIEMKGGGELISDEALINGIASYPPSVETYRSLARRYERRGMSRWAESVLNMGRTKLGIFWF